MPAIVIHKPIPANKQIPLRQLRSSFTMEPDGYIVVSLEFLVTDQGLGTRVIETLMPRPGTQLDTTIYNVRNIPAHRGLFVKTATVTYLNGLHYVLMECTTCLQKPQTVLHAIKQTRTFSGTSEERKNDSEGNTVITTHYFSFQMKAPEIQVATCHLVGETPSAQGVSVDLIGLQAVNRIAFGSVNGYINVTVPMGDYSRGVQYKINIINVVNKIGVSHSQNTFDLVESESSENDGSVVRSRKSWNMTMIEVDSSPV